MSRVLLPNNSAITAATGLPYPQKETARASACLVACRMLHKVRCTDYHLVDEHACTSWLCTLWLCMCISTAKRSSHLPRQQWHPLARTWFTAHNIEHRAL